MPTGASLKQVKEPDHVVDHAALNCGECGKNVEVY
jgi:hypothetical protein